ncbi:hypothetical protein QT979_02990 [Microcoleus sp. w2-18bC1]|uniref:hypothetical protein n=1 Tax=unclassified Microcoleus TaxID=2642155 RepID=UPI002FD4B6AF
MNEFMQAFQNIAQYSALVAADDDKSLEIKKSATTVIKSVQPGFDELRESATRLEKVVQKCRNDIDHAEDVWTCKLGIIQASKQEIWQQLGELSGCHVRINELGRQCQSSALAQSQDYWDKIFDVRVKQKWFIDAAKKQKKGIGWKEKDDFIKDIPIVMNLVCMEIDQIIKRSLDLVYQDLSTINLKVLTQYFQNLDKQTKDVWNHQMNSTFSQIANKFEQPNVYLPGNTQSLRSALISALDDLSKYRLGDLFWEEVVNFKKQVSTAVDNCINSIFDDRLYHGSRALVKAMRFYNEFLEKQDRYQKETPAQRQAERNWIDSQWTEIQRLEKGIKVILNSSP